MNYSEFYKLITNKQKQLESYGLENNCIGDSFYIAKMWLSDISSLSYTNKALRLQADNYLIKGSTIELRELLRVVDCDYWRNLNHQNACDLIDSLN